jgi:hypothetical protein
VEKKGTHDSWSNDHTQRTLHEVKLLEVSPVTGWPAYAATTASVRSLIGAIDWSDAESAERVLDGLTEDQRGLLLRVLNRRAPKPFIAPDVAAAQRRLEALMALHKPRP